jgi:hypothetical protein
MRCSGWTCNKEATRRRWRYRYVMSCGFGKRWALGAVFLSGAALVWAAPASADQTDSAFVAALAKGGITMSDPNTAVGMAHTVCAGLDANQPVSLVAMRLMKDTNFTPRQSGYFIGLSVAAYCPQDKDKTDDTSVTWLLPFPPLM